MYLCTPTCSFSRANPSFTLDEVQDNKKHGEYPECDRQCLLSLLQVGHKNLCKQKNISFRSMFRNVVASMNEALDIKRHLNPLTSHLKVQFKPKV